MGKRSNRRRRRQRSVLAQFTQRSLQRDLEEALVDEDSKRNQKKVVSKFAKIEQDILSRTVFVTQVLNLNDSQNLQKLHLFFQNNYGPVKKCVKASWKGGRKKGGRGSGFPPARVQFHNKKDAEKLFGSDLSSARRSSAVVIPCPVGYRGFIRVRPSDSYRGMAEEELKGSTIDFSATQLDLGFWPSVEEAGSSFIPGFADDLRESRFLIEYPVRQQVTVSIDLKTRTVEMRFPAHPADSHDLPHDDIISQMLSLLALGDGTLTGYVASFRFKDVRGSIDLVREGNGHALVFSLKHPPRLFEVKFQERLQEERYERCTSFPGMENCGKCLGYKFSLDDVAYSRLVLQENLEKFGLLRIETTVQSRLSCKRIIPSDANQVDEKLSRVENVKAGMLFRGILDSGKVSWYHALHDRASLVQNENSYDVFTLLDQAAAFDSQITLKVLGRIHRMYGSTQFPAKLFSALFVSEEDDIFTPVAAHCMEIPRILLTPTRMIFVGFEVEMSNRVIRRYVNDVHFPEEAFLRLSIGDENGDQLYADSISEEVGSSIKTRILSGIVINGRCYQFLAYSSSQLKELSVWMVCPEQNHSVESIRRWMGDFSECKTASKYAARMGQCFSTTFQAAEGQTSLFRQWGRSCLRVNDSLADVVPFATDGSNREMCHSDGTGLIEKQVLMDIVKKLPFGPPDPEDVSIIQIRFGGAKGTLTAWDLRSRLLKLPSGSDVYMRPSMVKFKAPYSHLEVVGVGKHVPYYLNRNVIMLLGVHGVKDRIFLDMQRTMLNDLDEMLTSRKKAAELLPRLKGADSGLTSMLLHVIAIGLSPHEEPLLFCCLHAIRMHHLTNLRKKSRILVERGAVLMGGLDETGLVPEGCVFVQVRDPQSTNGENNPSHHRTSFEPLVGPVMVTKHPVMHPGDVRMLLAVDIPELRQHRNVILFSQHGQRPEADKMAGSDLDGDQFAVTWDNRLFLNEWNCCQESVEGGYWLSSEGDCLTRRDLGKNWKCLEKANSKPMAYEPPPPPAVDEDGTISDNALIDHFIMHAKTANLGRIAMLWQDHAAEKTADCEECIKLAGLHSVAVDFPKSGVPAVIPQELVLPRSRPRAHWRELKHGEPFHCDRVIGQLYDEVVRRSESTKTLVITEKKALAGRKCTGRGQILCFAVWEQLSDCLDTTIYKTEIPSRLGFRDETDGRLLLFANDQREQYEEQLLDLMSKYHLHSEGELLTGCIQKYHRLHKRKRHDVSEELRRHYTELRKQFRASFFERVWDLASSYVDEEVTSSGTHAITAAETVASALSAPSESEEGQSAGYNEGDYPESTQSDDVIDWVQAVATGKMITERGNGSGMGDETAIRTIAWKLAAAYYISTYNPEMRWREHSPRNRRSDALAIFSFPWIVYDVIWFGTQ